MAKPDDDNHISISPVVFYMLLGAAGFGGLGGGYFFGPTIGQGALEACYKQAEAATAVAMHNSTDIEALRHRFDTTLPTTYSTTDARRDWEQQYKRDAQQDRAIELLEKAK